MEAEAGGKVGNQKVLTLFDLLKIFPLLTTALCTTLCLFCFTFKEALLQPEQQTYYGLKSIYVSMTFTSESIMFIGSSIIISLIPERKKNFVKLVLAGAIIFCIGMIIEGPFIGIPADDDGLMVIAGVAVGGIAGAFIMPAAVPALN